MQWQAKASSTGALVSVNSDGKYVLSNSTGSTLAISVTAIDGNGTISPSPLFTQVFDAMEGTLPTGSATKTSQAINAATHSSSIDIFDSLGSKHTITYTFRKEATSTWSWTATVPQPGDIGGVAPNQNVYTGGTVQFNSNGSLASVNPQSLSVTWNNGSTPNQQINLNFGTSNAFDGITSFDQKSATSLISQDGYTGGDLQGIRIDQNGVLIGSFTNGRSLGLAQISMAKFANNEGLMADGGNIFSQSANSGDPTIGAAASGGRGAIFSSALEMSNVDLSKSLTDLIVIQRGYQANSKTITTSDQMLQVLLQIKQ
jgi:flagellar hook protein FlgE